MSYTPCVRSTTEVYDFAVYVNLVRSRIIITSAKVEVK